MENKYRFLDSKNEHLHQLNVNGEWKPLIGTTTALNVLSKPLTYWAAGLAVAELGWIKPLTAYSKPKPTQEQIDANAKERLESARAMLEKINLMAGMQGTDGVMEYLKLLDKVNGT